MKKFFKILFVTLLVFSFYSCNVGGSGWDGNRSGTVYSQSVPVQKTIQPSVTYTVMEKGCQYLGNAYTTRFVYFVVLKNETTYRVVNVQPNFYEAVHVGDTIEIQGDKVILKH